MLLQDLSRNKKASVGLILVALSLIYIVSKKFLFRTVLGRLLLVGGLIATTNCNKMLGLVLLIVICLAYSQLSPDFENMENPVPVSTTPTGAAGGNTTTKTSPKMPATPPTTSPDTATVEEKKRKMVIGKSASSLPTPPKDETSSAKDVTGATSLKESFLGFSRYY